MRLEWLILADEAEVVNGKLYLMGGGWDKLWFNRQMPASRHMAVAASFRVPWNETNQRHGIEIELATEDGESLAKVTGQMEVGRPAGIAPGTEQRSQIAFSVDARFGKFGTYVVNARVDDQEQERVAFSVVPGSKLLAQQ